MVIYLHQIAGRLICPGLPANHGWEVVFRFQAGSYHRALGFSVVASVRGWVGSGWGLGWLGLRIELVSPFFVRCSLVDVSCGLGGIWETGMKKCQCSTTRCVLGNDWQDG